MFKTLNFSSTTRYWLNIYSFLLFPIILSVIFEGDSHLIKRIIYHMIFTLGLCFPFTLIPCRFHKHLMYIYVIAYILYWLEFYHIYTFKTELLPASIQIILDSNKFEVKEFAYETFTPTLFLSIIVYLTMIVFSFINTKKYTNCVSPNKTIIMITLLGLLFSISKDFHTYRYNKYQFLPYRVIYTTYNYYKEKLEIIKMRKNHKVPYISGLHTKNLNNLPETYIIVIGESASKKHLKYYGYYRDTTPFSAKYLSPIIFKNVSSPHASTLLSLKDTLTFSSKTNPEGIKLGSIINIFNQIGFKSFWISNQYSQGKYDNLTSVLAHDATTTLFLNDNKKYFIHHATDSHYDEDLLPFINQALSDKAPKKIIFIHLAGSHTPYQFRFPKTFDIFQEHNKNSFEKGFDDYDNSIRYTDFILSKITKAISKRKEQSFVLYFSDHGDDVRLEKDSCHCHTTNPKKQTPQMYEIPFILWFNHSYQKNNPQLVKQIKSYTERPFITHHLIHSLPTLAGLSFDLQEDDKNLFSPSFVPEKE